MFEQYPWSGSAAILRRVAPVMWWWARGWRLFLLLCDAFQRVWEKESVRCHCHETVDSLTAPERLITVLSFSLLSLRKRAVPQIDGKQLLVIMWDPMRHHVSGFINYVRLCDQLSLKAGLAGEGVIQMPGNRVPVKLWCRAGLNMQVFNICWNRRKLTWLN